MASLDEFTATAEPCVATDAPAVPASGYATILSIYGVAHVVVDASSAAVVFCIASTHAVQPDVFVALLLLYHVLAFGLQAFFGLLIDASSTPRLAAIVGCLVSASALLIPMPILGIVVVSLGNALFHVGGGAISLRIAPGRAAAPGLFVAPGSLGLLLGTVLGKTGTAALAPLIVATLVVCLLMICISIPGQEPVTSPKKLASRAELVLALILLSIAIRSFLGFLVLFPWETQPEALIALTVASCLGKALGGILADRWGWMRVAVASMLAALPFLACSSALPFAVIPGLFLLNMTMPVTLVAVAEAMPGRPGFAFGLSSLALLLGVIPQLLGYTVSGPIVICAAILLSVAALYRGLQVLSIDLPFKKTVRA